MANSAPRPDGVIPESFRRFLSSVGARLPSGDLIGPTATAILAYLMQKAQEGDRRATNRELARRFGLSPNGVHSLLVRLRDAGLLTWEEKHAATVRPTCTFIPASRI